ncbi:MAG: hypothetical protein ACYC91_05100 [Solirubrobacteraceae bacterium]
MTKAGLWAATAPAPGSCRDRRRECSLTAGERWTRDQLRSLHRGRFSPAAVGAFLLASQRRANEARAVRPELARQAAAWTMVGALASVSCGIRGGWDRRRTLGGLGWWSLCGLMLDWHLGMVETIDGRSRNLGVADALTLVRAWLVPLAWNRPRTGSCALAALTDLLDGPLARYTEPTRAGRDLEGLVDACFAISALHGAGTQDMLARPAVRAESLRIVLGTMYGMRTYFLGIAAPDAAVTRAARPLSGLRAGGLLLATAGHRACASWLVGTSAIASASLAMRAGLPEMASRNAIRV